MKKIAFAFLFCVSHFVNAQDVSKLTNAKEVVFYGLDFTKSRFVGEIGNRPDVIKDKHMEDWNVLMVSERENFDLKKAFGKEIYYDFVPVKQVNSTIDHTKLESINPIKIEFTKSDLEDAVKKYPLGDKKEGVGCSFIVATFDKYEQVTNIYVTFFDIASATVITAKKFSGKVGGIAFRNYWAGGIKDIIKKMDKKFDKWKL